MCKKSLAIILACVLVQMLSVQPATARSKEEKQAQLAHQVKTAIRNLGVGRETGVEVKPKDESRSAGYISEVKHESFILANARTGTTTSVAYADVTPVKSHSLSTGAKIAIGIGMAIVVITLAIWWGANGWNQ